MLRQGWSKMTGPCNHDSGAAVLKKGRSQSVMSEIVPTIRAVVLEPHPEPLSLRAGSTPAVEAQRQNRPTIDARFSKWWHGEFGDQHANVSDFNSQYNVR